MRELTFSFSHDVAHEVAGRSFGHYEVFRPSRQILQVKSDSVSFRQRVQVDRIKPEQVVAGELSQSCHFVIFLLFN